MRAKQAEKQAAIDKKKAFRATLEAQMQANAVRKVVAPMSTEERKINKQLLHKIDKFQAVGMSASEHV